MGWKIYLWALVILILLGYPQMLCSGPTVWEIVDMLVTPLAIVGLYGYAYKKQIIHQSLWKVWVFVVILWDVAYNVVLSGLLGVTLYGHLFEEMSLPCIALNWTVIAPTYVALYLYGYRSDSLWAPNRVPQ